MPEVEVLGLQIGDECGEAVGEGLEEFGAGGVGAEIESGEQAGGCESGAFSGEGFAQTGGGHGGVDGSCAWGRNGREHARATV